MSKCLKKMSVWLWGNVVYEHCKHIEKPVQRPWGRSLEDHLEKPNLTEANWTRGRIGRAGVVASIQEPDWSCLVAVARHWFFYLKWDVIWMFWSSILSRLSLEKYTRSPNSMFNQLVDSITKRVLYNILVNISY